MRARFPLLALALLANAPLLRAQTAERLFFRPQASPFSVDVEAGSVFNTNLERDTTNLHSHGFVTRVIFEAKKPAGNRVFHFRYIGDLQSYTGSDRFDRGTNGVTGVYYQSLTPAVSLTAVGGYSSRGPTEDLPADQYSGWSQLRYRASPAAEIGVFGSYRWVRPEDASRDENVLVAGFDFGGELGRSSVWEIGYQREQSESPTFGRAYHLDKLRAEYAWRLGRRTSLGVRLDHEKWVFPEWSFTAGDLVRISQEREWFPSAFFLHRFDSGKRLTVRWELQDRSTNHGSGAWRGQRLHATFRVPIVGGRPAPRGPGEGEGLSLPKLPDDVPNPDPPILHQLAYLSASPEFTSEPRTGTEESPAFARGSHWTDVLSAQGVPTGASEKPQFFEQVWQYGPSWVTFNDGRVVSWHDAGNLKLAPGSGESEPPLAPPRSQTEALERTARAPTRTETISSAFLRIAKPEIVLADGTRLKGVLRKYENGLAHLLLFVDERRTLLATMPEHLIDKKATKAFPEAATGEGNP